MQEHDEDYDQEQQLQQDGQRGPAQPEQPAQQRTSSGRRASEDAVNDLVGFVKYLATNLVDDPEQIRIVPENFGAAVHIKLIVPEEEMGKVIGRQGRVARSMRTLLTIAAARKGLRASLDIDS